MATDSTTAGDLFSLMRARTGLSKRQAATDLAVTHAALVHWEGGAITDARLWDVAKKWAEGKPTSREARPQFLVSYALFGRQFFLPAARNAIFVFADPEDACETALRLRDLGVEDVVVVPAWRSRLRSLERGGARLHEFLHGARTDPLSALMKFLAPLAAEHQRRFGAGADPP
jgi:hypothetical protein